MATRRINAPRETTSNEDLGFALAKLRRAKQRGAELTKNQQLIDKEIERNEQEKRCLTTKRLMAGGQYSDWLESVYQTTIIPFCKAWNLEFAAQIQARLPPEVRNMIYHHLWGIDARRSSPHTAARWHVCPYRDQKDSTSDLGTIGLYPRLVDIAQSLSRFDENVLRRLYDQSDLPHYLSPDYVGPITAIEVVRSFYKAFDATGFLVCGPQNIKRILTKDCFRVGLDTKNTIRSLIVHCKMDRYRTSRPKHPLWFNCRCTAANLAYVRKSLLRAEFRPLLNIKKKMGFELSILLIQRNVRLGVLAETIEALGEVYEAFRNNGATITVTWTYRGHFQAGRVVQDKDFVIKNITTFFDMPREAWEYNMKRFLKQVRGRIRPRHWKIDREVDIVKAISPSWIASTVHEMWLESENEFTTDGEDDTDGSESESGDNFWNSSSDNED